MDKDRMKSFFKKEPPNGILHAELSDVKPIEEPSFWETIRDQVVVEAKLLVNEFQEFFNIPEEPESSNAVVKPVVINKPKTFAEYKALGLEHSDSEAMESLEKAALLAESTFELDELLAGPLSGENLSETLLFNIINNKHCNEEIRKKILKITYLTENFLILLISLCETAEEITLLLQNQHIPQSMFMDLLYKDLNANHLLQVLNFIPLSPLHFKIIFFKTEANEKVRMKLYQHESLRSETLGFLLNKSTPRSLEEVTLLLKTKKLPSEFVLTKLDRKGTAEDAVRNNHSIEWNLLFIEAFHEFQHYQFSSELIDILREKDERMLATLPFISMINHCTTEDGLDTLIALRIHLKADSLEALAKKEMLNTEQMDNLLAAFHMSADIADILFERENYSGKIGHWTWLTKRQCLFTLTNTKDPASFEEALLHSSLSKKDREIWLKTLNNAYHKAIIALQSPPIKDPKAHILAILGGLKAKAYKHFLQLPAEAEAGQVSITLYQELHALLNAYFKPQALNLQAQVLLNNCQKAINKASPVLAVHRGYKQVFYNVLKMICVMGSLGLAKKQLEDCRFFKPETDSIKEVNKIASYIQDLAAPAA